MAVNNNNKVKAILSQIQKARPSKEELEKKEVALSLVNDIDSEFSWLEQSFSEASYLAYDAGDEWLDRIAEFRSEVMIFWDNAVVNGAATSLEEAAERMAEKLEELEQKANDLGVDPADLVSNYEDIKDILSNWQSTYDEARKKYQDVRAAMEFGMMDFW